VRGTYRVLLVAAAGAVAAATVAGPSAAQAAPRASAASTHTAPMAHQLKKSGSAKATARSVNVRQLMSRLHAARKTGAAASARAPQLSVTTPNGATITSAFDGIASAATGPIDGRPDPSSATNGSQILETAGNSFRIFDNTGAAVCGTGMTLNQFLGTSDTLAGQHVEFDNFQGHFIIDTAVVDTASTAAPALWVAVSNTSNPCQSWILYRLTFSGGPYTPGSVLDSTILGQDRRAVLVEANVFSTTGGSFKAFSVFAITKSALYAGSNVSFSTFTTASQAAPMSSAGEPMIDSPFAFFLGADPQIGYQLYQMSGTGTASPSVSLAATIGSPYSAPSQALQPGGSIGPNAGDGRITSSPVFDGSRLWFAHGVSQIFHPTSVRFGYVNLVSNTETHALATVSPLHSDEFNGSVGVGLNADGTEGIVVNWAYTDPDNGVNVSPAVDSFVFNGSVPSTFGNEQTLLTGTVIDTTNFGNFSSVSIDPNKVGNTTCAVTTQEYFNGTWRTRLARICSPTTVVVPSVTGMTPGQASAILSPIDLHISQTNTTACSASASGTILSTSPAAGQQAPLGSTVSITVCTAPTTTAVPSVVGRTVANATATLQAAGLTVGSITGVRSCDVLANDIVSQSPRAGMIVSIGSAVNLVKSLGPPPKNPCP
jgi:hypothetical protein